MSRRLSSACLVVLWTASVSGQTADPKLLERAKRLLDSAPLIDTHNDLPTHLLEQLGGDLTRADLGTVQSSLCADVPRLREGHVGAQYWAVFVESATMKTHTSLREALREFDVALRFIRSQPCFGTGAHGRRYRADPQVGPHRVAPWRRRRAHPREFVRGPPDPLGAGRPVHDADALGHGRVGRRRH